MNEIGTSIVIILCILVIWNIILGIGQLLWGACQISIQDADGKDLMFFANGLSECMLFIFLYVWTQL